MKRLHPSWQANPAALGLAVVSGNSAEAVRQPMLFIMDALQRLPARTQIEALAAAVVVVANAIGRDPHDLISRARRQVPELEAFEHDVLALADYAKGELTNVR